VLEELRITDLGVIASAVLEPGPGLTALTGETGAGKTMVLHGLGLLFGARADSALVRPGADRTVVDGRLRLPAQGSVRDRLREAGAELAEDEVLLTRTVTAEGRSRCVAGGRPVPVGVLADIAADLVAVHGQADQQRLRHPGEQRAALDRFGGPALAEALGAYRSSYDTWRAARSELEALEGDGRTRDAEAEELRDALARIAAVAPRAGEDADLGARTARLEHAEALRAAAGLAHGLLTGETSGEGDLAGSSDGVRGMLVAATRSLAAVAAHDTALAALSERLTEAGYALDDVTSELVHYLSELEADPAALAAVQERRAALTSLTRRYGPDLEAVLAYAAAATPRLADLEGGDARRSELTSALKGYAQDLAGRAGELTAARVAAAARFAARVSAELAALAMPAARVGARVRALSAPGPSGGDEVEFTLVSHAGSPERPLAKSASGGELSRVMLAVEVVLAGADPVPTMVFDEVDAGVGGAAAVEVGRRLCRLARDHQVLVVTHLAQVAAFADLQLQVERDGDRTTVVTLEGESRVRELSRMLGGLADSALARGHAEELLAVAELERRTTTLA
jgi:DNA repair protein RecN (Recombination protein N)